MNAAQLGVARHFYSFFLAGTVRSKERRHDGRPRQRTAGHSTEGQTAERGAAAGRSERGRRGNANGRMEWSDIGLYTFFSPSTIYILLLIFSPDPLYSREYSRILRIFYHAAGRRRPKTALKSKVEVCAPKPPRNVRNLNFPSASTQNLLLGAKELFREALVKTVLDAAIVTSRIFKNILRLEVNQGQGLKKARIFLRKKPAGASTFSRIFSNTKVRGTLYILYSQRYSRIWCQLSGPKRRRSARGSPCRTKRDQRRWRATREPRRRSSEAKVDDDDAPSRSSFLTASEREIFFEITTLTVIWARHSLSRRQ